MLLNLMEEAIKVMKTKALLCPWALCGPNRLPADGSRNGILERQFYSRFLGISLILLRLGFLSGLYSPYSVLQNTIHE